MVDINAIFTEKLNNIQSRIPVKIGSTPKNSFKDILDKTTANDYAYKDISSMENDIDYVINTASKKYNIDPDLIKSIVRAESNFNYEAISNKGAMGLMQLMPGTAKALGVENPFDVEQNIDGGVRYFKEMLDKFNGNLDLALAAYNAGPNAVLKYDGVPPYNETKNYIKNIKENYNSIQGK